MNEITDKELSEIEVSNFDFVKHNPTDYDSFKDFADNLNNRYEQEEKQRKIEARKANLIKWIESVPERWRKASLKTLDDENMRSDIQTKFKEKQKGYYIAGPHTSGKTFVAYAIIRSLVAGGAVKPSQIKVISERELLSLATGGFETREKFDKIFDEKYKLYLFDSAGTKDFYESKRELPAIASIIEAAYNRSSFFIVTSFQSSELYQSTLSGSSSAKLDNMVKDGLLYTGEALQSFDDDTQSKKNPVGW